MTLRSLLPFFLLGAAVLAPPAPRAAAQPPVNSYTAITMGYTSGLNDAGHIVGDYDTSDLFRRAYLLYYQVEWVFTDLGTLGGTYSSASGVNNYDHVVGTSTTLWDVDYHAFLWDGNVGMIDLGTLGGSWSHGIAINDSGQVVGQSQTAAGATRAFLWRNGQMVELPLPAGYTNSFATGINASGQVVGHVHNAAGESFPYRWTPTVPNGTTGTMVLLETTADHGVFAINASGDAVGRFGWQPALWSGAGGAASILSATSGGEAKAINNSRVVVGGGGGLTFVWDPANGARDLNRLADVEPWVMLHDAHAVNASGQILAVMEFYRGYLLTPSPLPSYPRNVEYTRVGASVTLSWSASYGADSYRVWRGTAEGIAAVGSATSTSWSTTDSESGVSYYVSAVNSYGEGAMSDAALPAAPAPPTNLTATGGKKKVTLAWKASVSGVTLTRIYRSFTSGGPYSLRATVNSGTSYTDLSVSTGRTYFYVVTAVNSIGKESVYSNQASAKAR
jgi:probable HAF family extracellular repeat protein